MFEQLKAKLEDKFGSSIEVRVVGIPEFIEVSPSGSDKTSVTIRSTDGSGWQTRMYVDHHSLSDSDVPRLITELTVMRNVMQFIRNNRPVPLPMCGKYQDFGELVVSLVHRVGNLRLETFRESGVEHLIKQEYDAWRKAMEGCPDDELEAEWECYGIRGPLRQAVINIYDRVVWATYDSEELDNITLKRGR